MDGTLSAAIADYIEPAQSKTKLEPLKKALNRTC